MHFLGGGGFMELLPCSTKNVLSVINETLANFGATVVTVGKGMDITNNVTFSRKGAMLVQIRRTIDVFFFTWKS